MSWWLILIAVIMILLIAALILYLVVLYSSVEDKNQAWFPKLIVVAGLSLSCFAVLLLPFDVSNRTDPSKGLSGGGINTPLIWQILLWTIAVFSIVIVPFTTFYYESWDPDSDSVFRQIAPAMAYTFASVIVFAILLIVLWLTVGNATLSLKSYQSAPQYVTRTEDVVMVETFTNSNLKFRVSIFVYMVGLMSAIGWVAFVVFCGIGLTTLPVNLISDWINRPKPIPLEEYVRRKDLIGERSNKLIEAGKKLEESQRSGKGGRGMRTKVNLFKAEVMELEKKYEILETSYQDKGGSPILAFGKLLLGIVSIFISIAWCLHIILNNIIGVLPFLNTLFVWLDGIFALFGVIAYGLFSFYLLWAVISGLFTFGFRLLFFKVHPMKVNDTLMNSFLFNTMVIMICSITVTQFCAQSFRSYASNTAVDSIFATYVQKLQGLGYIISYFQYALVAVMGLAGIWACACSHRKKDRLKDEFNLD